MTNSPTPGAEIHCRSMYIWSLSTGPELNFRCCSLLARNRRRAFRRSCLLLLVCGLQFEVDGSRDSPAAVGMLFKRGSTISAAEGGALLLSLLQLQYLVTTRMPG